MKNYILHLIDYTTNLLEKDSIIVYEIYEQLKLEINKILKDLK